MHLPNADQFSSPVKLTRQLATGYHRLISKLTISVLLFFICLKVIDWLGLRFNTSRSVDPGFYWVIDKPVEKGDLVSFCLETNPLTQMAYQRGYVGFGNCPGQTERLLKIVYGAVGDSIELKSDGVAVNGILLPFSAALTQDGLERPLAPYSPKRLVLKSDELWVMTNRSPLSFDSRYFGPIQSNQVSDVVLPLWTWH